ncbi:O-acetylhomoserine aminocarboxypropyltransferase/cysteine synthase [Dysgonomonas sp. Marseille-P4677]|uniref:PLP-dependent transferase n=1 Tax=Dysgonomonas sp. Marseille-P4677 TaxID=2364790 RepID=UPI0019126D2E|nr:PLP-dependent transferase [Dysgonomonas sp. Marseille-P4677]MBK5721166.1 O-acetylhomoserine aminocarboxypropyltransferase/cysteine synthase [Dysgonomonas sp. Marseille-P4677]
MAKNDSRNKGFSTRIINEKFKRKDAHGAIAMPIYRNAAFEFPDSESIANAFQYKEEIASHTYTRITNPTVENLEHKIQAASGAENVMMVASGMAAISNTFLSLAYAGSNIVTSPHLFGNTFSLFKFTLAAFGVEVRFVNTDDLEEIASAIDENTCAFFCELITNPHLEIADLPEISKILKARNVPMIVDTTVIPWCAFDPRKAGVDIEVVSTTKYISGGATTIGGAILDYGTFDWAHNKRLKTVSKTATMSQFSFKLKREIARNIGAAMDPETASLQALGMETLQLRYEKMSSSAYQLAQFLSDQKEIVKVGYPKLESSKYKSISDNLFYGNPGAMLTFSLESREACYKFMDKLQIIRRATNLFDNKTLIIHPESTIYGTFSPEMKTVMGIEPNLMRLSVGLEDVSDLQGDIEQALAILG